ncbi:MAG: Mpo1-like protein [Polyangiales bacterium]
MSASLDDYLRTYQRDHQHPMNRLTHLVGIPAIVASLPLLLKRPRLGAKLFVGGWALQFLGHWFEAKPPSFLSRDWRYLAIGQLWIANEWAEILTGKPIYTPPPAPADAE